MFITTEDILAKLRNIKVPEAIYSYPNKAILLDALKKEKDVEYMFKNNFLALQQLFNNALLQIQQKYQGMSFDEIAYCICLRNCKKEDFINLPWIITIADLKNLLILKQKYNNQLVNSAYNAVMNYRARWLFLLFINDFMNTFTYLQSLKDIKVKNYDYDYIYKDENNKKILQLHYRFYLNKIRCKNQQNKIEYLTKDDIARIENIYSIMVDETKDSVIFSVYELYARKNGQEKENNIIFDLT